MGMERNGGQSLHVGISTSLVVYEISAYGADGSVTLPFCDVGMRQAPSKVVGIPSHPFMTMSCLAILSFLEFSSFAGGSVVP